MTNFRRKNPETSPLSKKFFQYQKLQKQSHLYDAFFVRQSFVHHRDNPLLFTELFATSRWTGPTLG